MIAPAKATSRVVASVMVAMCVLIGACGGKSTSSSGVLGKDVKPISDTLVPANVLGLTTSREDVAKALSQGSRSYVDSSSVYSLRTPDNLLQATLQVSHFVADTKYQSPKFRQTVVAGIGGTRPRLVHLGSDIVYLTTGNQQRISIWFRGRYLFILATRNDYDQPRTLLRKVMEVNP